MRKLVITTLLLVTGCASTQLSARSEQDLQRDATSKPFAVLEFLGVQSGWTVLDLFAGSGYYSEVLANVVGPEGTVYLHNNAAYLQFTEGLDERLQDNRLPNVQQLNREIAAIDLPEASVDLVLMVMTYHDAYFETEGWDVTAEPLFAAVTRVLKPGGILGIVDHHAASGSGKDHAQDLHRIDAEFARADIEARGFKLLASSEILLNPEDDLSINVFDPQVRGKTSRFVYRFEKR